MSLRRGRHQCPPPPRSAPFQPRPPAAGPAIERTACGAEERPQARPCPFDREILREKARKRASVEAGAPAAAPGHGEGSPSLQRRSRAGPGVARSTRFRSRWSSRGQGADSARNDRSERLGATRSDGLQRRAARAAGRSARRTANHRDTMRPPGEADRPATARRLMSHSTRASVDRAARAHPHAPSLPRRQSVADPGPPGLISRA